MQDILSRAKKLFDDVSKSMDALDINDKKAQIQKLEEISRGTNFWQDGESAKNTMQKIANLNEQVSSWKTLEKEVKEIIDLCNLEDESLYGDLSEQLKLAQDKFSALSQDLIYGGEYDEYDVVLSIYAGAGGTDAQDWSEMLFRMYYRYAEKIGAKVRVLDESPGDIAGLKSVTVAISGSLIYGKLKSENGVHRLVRLSPFNADNLRQTSFAKVEVLPKIDTPDQVEIEEKDLKIDVFRAGGHGGQSVNTTDSAVRITHLPTGISVSIQNERSQIQNKETALTILRSKLMMLKKDQHASKIADLKGPSAANEWGSQIRNYVLHPYKQVKDLRSNYETSDAEGVLDGNLDELISAYQQWLVTKK